MTASSRPRPGSSRRPDGGVPVTSDDPSCWAGAGRSLVASADGSTVLSPAGGRISTIAWSEVPAVEAHAGPQGDDRPPSAPVGDDAGCGRPPAAAPLTVEVVAGRHRFVAPGDDLCSFVSGVDAVRPGTEPGPHQRPVALRTVAEA